MPSILLPKRPDRSWLDGFWIGLVITLGSPVVVAAWLSSGWSTATTVLIVAGLGLIGPFARRMVERTYRAWNRLAREYVRFARAVLMGTCYFIIFAVVGCLGSKLPVDVRGATGSFWSKRNGERAQRSNTEPHWVRDYLRWTRTTKQMWAILLLPFLWLLRILDAERAVAPPGDIYTLY